MVARPTNADHRRAERMARRADLRLAGPIAGSGDLCQVRWWRHLPSRISGAEFRRCQFTVLGASRLYNEKNLLSRWKIKILKTSAILIIRLIPVSDFLRPSAFDNGLYQGGSADQGLPPSSVA